MRLRELIVKSSRAKSSRKSSGLLGEMLRLLPVFVFVNAPRASIVRYTFAMALPSGVINAEMLFPGIGTFVLPAVPGWYREVDKAEKSPFSIAVVGTVNKVG